MNDIVWTLDVRAAVGRKVLIETRDGVHRRGRLDGVDVREVPFLGTSRPVPVAVVLDGDAIPIERISSVTEIP